MNLITDMSLLVRTQDVLKQLKKSGGQEYDAVTAITYRNSWGES